MDDASVQGPLEAVIRITTENICGSDLHPYEGRAHLDAGMVLGHENMGIVEAVGSGVERILVGGQGLCPLQPRLRNLQELQ
ncbi:MAG: alcohol dehydrogenase catalytic domain-containing protein [Specibacter sp.]